MKIFPSSPGYVLALLAVVLGLAFVITGSAWGMMVVAIAEAALWASVQYVRQLRLKRDGRDHRHVV